MHTSDRLLSLYALTCFRLYIEPYYSVLLRQNYSKHKRLNAFFRTFQQAKIAKGLNLFQLWKIRIKSIRNPKKKKPKYHKLRLTSIWLPSYII